MVQPPANRYLVNTALGSASTGRRIILVVVASSVVVVAVLVLSLLSSLQAGSPKAEETTRAASALPLDSPSAVLPVMPDASPVLATAP